MIIIDRHIGQMCNRLWSLLPIISFSIEQKERIVIIWGPSDIESFFPHVKSFGNLQFVLSGKTRPSWWWRGELFLHKIFPYIDKPLEEFKSKRKFTIHFIDAWKHSEDASFISKNKKVIKELFTPNLATTYKLHKSIPPFGGVTIGVHIRMGDYKEYLSGRYYFGVEKWAKYIEHLNSIFDTKHIRFLICSNENNICEQISKILPNINIFSIRNTDGLTDLYALTKCDYIIGVPSSYSQWASFIGDVPLYLITSERYPQINEFHKIISFNQFDNGSRLVLKKECYQIVKNDCNYAPKGRQQDR